jgi:hypothetical protein
MSAFALIVNPTAAGFIKLDPVPAVEFGCKYI